MSAPKLMQGPKPKQASPGLSAQQMTQPGGPAIRALPKLSPSCGLLLSPDTQSCRKQQSASPWGRKSRGQARSGKHSAWKSSPLPNSHTLLLSYPGFKLRTSKSSHKSNTGMMAGEKCSARKPPSSAVPQLAPGEGHGVKWKRNLNDEVTWCPSQLMMGQAGFPSPARQNCQAQVCI